MAGNSQATSAMDVLAVDAVRFGTPVDLGGALASGPVAVVVTDVFSGQIVGWHIDNATTQLAVRAALGMPLRFIGKPRKVIITCHIEAAPIEPVRLHGTPVHQIDPIACLEHIGVAVELAGLTDVAWSRDLFARTLRQSAKALCGARRANCLTLLEADGCLRTAMVKTNAHPREFEGLNVAPSLIYADSMRTARIDQLALSACLPFMFSAESGLATKNADGVWEAFGERFDLGDTGDVQVSLIWDPLARAAWALIYDQAGQTVRTFDPIQMPRVL
jgi:hypothetical protein